jgi:hypothetical protein
MTIISYEEFHFAANKYFKLRGVKDKEGSGLSPEPLEISGNILKNVPAPSVSFLSLSYSLQ